MNKSEAQIDSLLRKLNSANDTIRRLQQEVIFIWFFIFNSEN